MGRNPDATAIVKNLAQRYFALARGHFDEVFRLEFFSDDQQKAVLLEKGNRARQKQVILMDVVFGDPNLSNEWRADVAHLLRHTKAFWHELRTAIQDSNGAAEISVQQASRKVSAQVQLRGINEALNRLCNPSVADVGALPPSIRDEKESL